MTRGGEREREKGRKYEVDVCGGGLQLELIHLRVYMCSDENKQIIDSVHVFLTSSIDMCLFCVVITVVVVVQTLIVQLRECSYNAVFAIYIVLCSWRISVFYSSNISLDGNNTRKSVLCLFRQETSGKKRTRKVLLKEGRAIL